MAGLTRTVSRSVYAVRVFTLRSFRLKLRLRLDILLQVRRHIVFLIINLLWICGFCGILRCDVMFSLGVCGRNVDVLPWWPWIMSHSRRRWRRSLFWCERLEGRDPEACVGSARQGPAHWSRVGGLGGHIVRVCQAVYHSWHWATGDRFRIPGTGVYAATAGDTAVRRAHTDITGRQGVLTTQARCGSLTPETVTVKFSSQVDIHRGFRRLWYGADIRTGQWRSTGAADGGRSGHCHWIQRLGILSYSLQQFQFLKV